MEDNFLDIKFPDDYEEFFARRSIRIVQVKSKLEYEKWIEKGSTEDKQISEEKPDDNSSQMIEEENTSLQDDVAEHKELFAMITATSVIFPKGLEDGLVCIKCQKTNLSLTMNHCESCRKKNAKPSCFICKKPNPDYHCDPSLNCFHMYHRECFKLWPQASSSDCPKHRCHSCYAKDCNRNGSLIKCIKCPAAFHADIFCLPAGSKVITKSQILCPRHRLNGWKGKPFNIDWCIVCGEFGSLICCNSCSYSFHMKCAEVNSSEMKFKCRSCVAGRMPLNFTVVWAKPRNMRWWPSLILPDFFVPQEVLKMKKHDLELCVRLFGSYKFLWTTSDRVFPFNGSTINSDSYIPRTMLYESSIRDALQMHKYLSLLQLITTQPIQGTFQEITSNIPVPPVEIKSIANEVDSCNCKLNDPCGPQSGCLNRSTGFECDISCEMSDSCQNQDIKMKRSAKIKVGRALASDFGLFTLQDLRAGSFVIEYIGELINKNEMQRRMKAMRTNREKNFYFLTVTSDLYIDSFKFGNLSRFVNHSCDPNCNAEKMIVDGITRIGIYTNCDVKAGTELTFNYQMKIFGEEIECFCGSSKCSGSIGEQAPETKRVKLNINH